jgi:hypothetical protein
LDEIDEAQAEEAQLVSAHFGAPVYYALWSLPRRASIRQRDRTSLVPWWVGAP